MCQPGQVLTKKKQAAEKALLAAEKAQEAAVRL
jgi:hypothetical protein